eukprot:214570_1
MSTKVTPLIELFVFAYVRDNTNINQIIPTPIIHLIKHFYNSLIHWKSAKLTQQHMKSTIKAPKISLLGTTLQIGVSSAFINRHRYKYISHSLILIMNKFEPEDNLISFTMEVTIQTHDKTISKILTFNKSPDKNSNNIQYNFNSETWVIINETIRIYHNAYDAIHPTTTTRTGSEIQFVENNNDIYNIDITIGIDMIQKTYFKMNIVQLVKWKDIAGIGWTNNNLYVRLVRGNYRYGAATNRACVHVQLLEVPFKIQFVHISVEFIKYDKVLLESLNVCAIDSKSGNGKQLTRITFAAQWSMLKTVDVLKIKIIKLFDVHNNEIHKGNWSRYGFQS